MDFKDLLNDLIPLVGQKAVDELKGLLDTVSADSEDEWQKSILNLLADAVAKHGPIGIQMAQDAINSLLADEPVPVIDWANPRVASDIVAQLQKLEYERRDEVSVFTQSLTNTLSQVLSGLVRGLVDSL